MDCVKHFSHDHPLSLFQVGDHEDPKPHRCNLCGLPVLSSPSYTCTNNDANCNFFLHKPCSQLPTEFFYDDHSDTLYLEQHESCKNFTCKCKNCEFSIHPLVAKRMEIKSKHVSHSHPLVALCREILSTCDGCGEEHKGFFFYCQHQDCHFWIHQDCTVLPSIVILSTSPHPHILTYAPPFNIITNKVECTVCGRSWRLRKHGVYFCGESYSFAHVRCAYLTRKYLPAESVPLTQLPDEEEDTYPSLVIRRCAQGNPSTQTQTQTYHKHPLILEDGNYNMMSSDLVCDVCIKPINNKSSPFYRCQSDGCHFLAHQICATSLPHSLDNFFSFDVKGFLCADSDSKKFFTNSVFACFMCYRPSNGFFYQVSEGGQVVGWCDPECSVAPKTIKHSSHKQHVLFQSFRKSSTPISCCSDISLFFDLYRCVFCDFSIHIRCALLPKKARHKFDNHSLELIMSRDDNKPEQVQLFCEFCEEEIELKLWYYGCRECEQYFHINCIPSVGYLSKIKFGKTHVDHQLHQHPLTLTQMLTHGFNERCGVCNNIIKGFAHDEMAFHCSPCHFWIHFSCVVDTPGSQDYSQYLKRIELSLNGWYSENIGTTFF